MKPYDRSTRLAQRVEVMAWWGKQDSVTVPAILDIFFDFSAAKITNIILKKNEFSICLLFDGDALYRKNKVITGRFYFFQKKVLTFIIL